MQMKAPHLVDRKSALWMYLPDDLKGLMVDGELLVEDSKDIAKRISDHSFLVFPFSKAYEGFLKKLFLDLDLIREDEYYGDDIRIGRILNPHFVDENENVFNKLCKAHEEHNGCVERLWEMWQIGRNRVFHYFPHNFRKLTQEEATEIIRDLIAAMEDAVERFYENDLK